MNYFTALTDNTKFITPCADVYSNFQTDIDLLPGYNSKCCCGDELFSNRYLKNYNFFTEKFNNKKCCKK